MPAAAPESRTAILDAAEARFAVQGFDATTIKEIASDAGVNSALLYYYFADKDALYGAAVSRLIGRLATEMAQSFNGVDSVPETIRRFIAGQADIGEQFCGTRIIVRQGAMRGPEVIVLAAPALQSEANVLQHRHARESPRYLETAQQTEAGDGIGLQGRDIRAGERDRAAGRLQKPAQQVEACGLAGAVGTDQGVDVACANAEIDVRHSREIAKAFRQAPCLQNWAGGPGASVDIARADAGDDTHDRNTT